MTTTTLFRTHRSQAVRLPNDVAVPPGVREVTILRDGPRRVIVPAGASWDEFFDAPGTDLGERNQPKGGEFTRVDGLRCEDWLGGSAV